MRLGEIMEESKLFCHRGDCYIHVEMCNGKNCNIIIAGDGQAIVHGVVGIIHRISEKAEISFKETLKLLRDYNKMMEKAGNAGTQEIIEDGEIKPYDENQT